MNVIIEWRPGKFSSYFWPSMKKWLSAVSGRRKPDLQPPAYILQRVAAGATRRRLALELSALVYSAEVRRRPNRLGRLNQNFL